MKYALIPILNKLAEWMDANEYGDLTLDQFIDTFDDDSRNDCMEWVHEIYHANKQPITIIEPCPEEKAIREIQS